MKNTVDLFLKDKILHIQKPSDQFNEKNSIKKCDLLILFQFIFQWYYGFKNQEGGARDYIHQYMKYYCSHNWELAPSFNYLIEQISESAENAKAMQCLKVSRFWGGGANVSVLQMIQGLLLHHNAKDSVDVKDTCTGFYLSS